jgi:uncharacterized protein involved in type VI secretion and phage assembly
MMFDRAKAASEQRAATSIAALDSTRRLMAPAMAATTRRAGTRTFVLKDSVWTDLGYVPSATAVRTLRIKAYSKAYFDLMDAVPELRPIFAIGDRLIVKGRKIAIVVGPEGVENVDVKAIAGEW